jgi:hypothetical protein
LTQRAPRTSVAARPPSVSSTVWAWPVSTNQPNAPSPSVKASASGANRRFDPSVIDALSNDVPKRGLRSAAASSPGTRCRSALSSGGGRRCIGSRAPRAGTGNGPDVHTPGTGSLSANAAGTTPADMSIPSLGLRPPSSTAPETPTSTTAGSPPLGQTRLELRLVHRHDPPPRASGRTIHLHHLRSRDGGLRISANQEVGRAKWK